MLLMSLSSRRQSKYQLQFEAGQRKTKQGCLGNAEELPRRDGNVTAQLKGHSPLVTRLEQIAPEEKQEPTLTSWHSHKTMGISEVAVENNLIFHNDRGQNRVIITLLWFQHRALPSKLLNRNKQQLPWRLLSGAEEAI